MTRSPASLPFLQDPEVIWRGSINSVESVSRIGKLGPSSWQLLVRRPCDFHPLVRCLRPEHSGGVEFREIICSNGFGLELIGSYSATSTCLSPIRIVHDDLAIKVALLANGTEEL